jgi:hypothetical protein
MGTHFDEGKMTGRVGPLVPHGVKVLEEKAAAAID